MKNSLGETVFHPLVYLKKASKRYHANRAEIHQKVPDIYPYDPMALPASRWKKSDTLFLLGSGPSINQFTSKQWEVIRTSDSAGWNFWLYHEFVPTFFFFEIPDAASPCSVLSQLLKFRAAQYQNTPVIMSDISQAAKRCQRAGLESWEKLVCFEQLPHFHAIHNIGIPGKSISSMHAWMRYYTWSGVFKSSPNLWYLPKRRASLCMLILFGVMAGYRKIVLSGIDYNQPGYFYDHERYKSLPQFERHQGTVNLTADTKVNPITVEHVVNALDKEVLSRKGVSLYVANESSPLYPKIPLFPEFQA